MVSEVNTSQVGSPPVEQISSTQSSVALDPISSARKPAKQKKIAKPTTGFPRTDAGNAEYFENLHGKHVRYDHKQKRWVMWHRTRHRWVEDRRGKVRLWMIETARHRLKTAARWPANTAEEKEEQKREIRWALASEDRYRIDAALELAKSQPPISDSGEHWDQDPFSIGVANGILDLRTGRVKQATQADRITKFLNVKFDPAAKCPRFARFLNEIFPGDGELIRFVQKAAGYSLTGSTEEQCLFACYGEGSNGKSTLLEALLHVFGPYGTDLPFSALEVKRNGAVLGEGINLVGARFAKAVEVVENRRLDEARVKALTGGDTITVRPLYRHAFSFQPTHKMWLSFNHKPIITDNSHAMWRRIRLIPFNQRFEGKHKTTRLLDRLKSEASGILNWAVEGYKLWRKEGLGSPKAVEEATQQYQQESDVLKPFFDDCIVGDPAEHVESARVWGGYLKWSEQQGKGTLSRNAFADGLKRAGFTSAELGHDKTRVWHGLKLRPECADQGILERLTS